MLDVARHFFGVADVCRVIDRLADYKLNVLHLHLSDDQGWRIAVDAWPRLTEHGGFYTHDDLRAIVRYAADRFITVVPEIDAPGHVQAAIAAYPELGVPGSSTERYFGTDVGFSSLDVHSALTYRFLDDVFGELAALTPGPFLHIGGDEAHSTSRADYLAFMERVQPLVAKHGKRLIGWEEVASAPLADGAVVQHWKDPELARAAAEQGAQLVMSPADRVYLDMKYDADTPLGLSWAGHVELRDSYEWDPAESDSARRRSSASRRRSGRRRSRRSRSSRRCCSRASARSPRSAWSPRSARDWDDFRARVAAEGARWDAAGVAYHRSPQVDWR